MKIDMVKQELKNRIGDFVQDEATDLYCLIMEFVEGVNLGDRIVTRSGMRRIRSSAGCTS